HKRIKKLSDVVELTGFFFRPEFIVPASTLLIQKKMDIHQTQSALEHALQKLSALTTFNYESLQTSMGTLAQELNLTNSQFFGVLRVAVTGQQVSTPLFESMEILGKDVSIDHIRLALENLQKTGNPLIVQS
ncbi:MAG: glutamate--tRNA ligase, partial [Anaerolineae bacterium]|nr:glutamate--tRNA ligase [Anaerolineae bacterium]